tara:strand:+ start:1971 stop:2645 length:675 start_codon:yes stop_codon:yes gene_type:complete
MKRIEAVLSDGGNILFSDEGVKKGPYEKISPHIPGLTYDQFRDGFQQYKILAQTVPDYDNKSALKDYLDSIGEPKVFEVVSKQKKERNGKQLELIDGIYDTLQTLYEHDVPYIILTDATKPGEQLQPFLAKLGIELFVTDMISSKDVGVRKPDPIFFNAALDKYGWKKEDVIFVAHDDDELVGAHELGIKVYAFNFKPEQDLSWLPDEQKLYDFRELEKVVLGD